MGREEGGGFRMGTHVYLWRIHFDIWQNQYNIVKFKNKIKLKKKKHDFTLLLPGLQQLSVACSTKLMILWLTFKVPPGEEVSVLLKIKVQNLGFHSWFCQILALSLWEGRLTPLESDLRYL